MRRNRTGDKRTGTITAAGKLITVTQHAVPVPTKVTGVRVHKK
jgi:hypothetical protein